MSSVVFESDVSASVATVPNGLVFAFLCFVLDGHAVDSAQIVVDARVARGGIVVGRRVQFGAFHKATIIVTDDCIGPNKAEFAHISQVNLVVVVTIDIVAATVEVVE